jgi:hypothetical protein
MRPEPWHNARVRRRDPARRRSPREPSPLDFCGWCFEWIDEDADHLRERLDRSVADSRNSLFFDGHIDGRAVFGIVPQPGCAPELAGAGAVVILCSESCRQELQIAVARHEARARGEDVPPLTPSAAERAEAENLLKEHCPWCLGHIADDAPVVTVATRMSDLDVEAGAIVSINVGNRMPHALVVPPGLLPEHPDCNVVFIACSPDCAKALSALLHDDMARQRPH